MFVFISSAVVETRNTIHWPKAAVPGDCCGNVKRLEQARFLNPIIELMAFPQQSITSCITMATISPPIGVVLLAPPDVFKCRIFAYC